VEEGEPLSKDSLIKGTIIMAGAAFIARFLGLVQKVPLQHILGDEGMASYGIAYNVYSMLLVVATAGIPSALSKLVSERYATRRTLEAHRIYGAAALFAAVAGVLSAALLFALAPAYASGVAEDPDAVGAIRAIAPALLVFPLIAVMRGYFQGRQNMMAGGLSQIAEQILRVATAVGLAYALMRLGYGQATVAAGASFGAVTGAAAALAVMLRFQRARMREDRRTGLLPPHGQVSAVRKRALPSYRSCYRLLLKLSIPITIISLTVSMVYFIDISTVIGLLDDRVGYSEAKAQLGILTGKAQSLAGIPPILAIALGTSAVPVISAAFARGERAVVANQTSLALRLSLVTGFPAVLVLTVAAEAVIGFLFSDAVGWEIAAMLTATTIFQIVMMTSASVLMGLGQTVAPMLYVAVGLAVKLIGNLTLGRAFGMAGILTATWLCLLLIMALNLLRLRRLVDYRILGDRWPGFLLTAAVTTAAGIGLVALFDLPLFPGGRLGYLLEAATVGGALALLYALCLFRFRVVSEEDVRRLPAPLQKALGPFRRRFLRVGRAERQE
jgi:stage V sporulation protein B